MLAGLLELLPWLHQWHAEKSDDYGGDSPAAYYEAFLNGQCQELALTHDDLRAAASPRQDPRRPHAQGAQGRQAARAKKSAKAPRAKKSAEPPPPEPTLALDPTPPPASPPPPAEDDGWKSTKKTSKKTRARKPSEPA